MNERPDQPNSTETKRSDELKPSDNLQETAQVVGADTAMQMGLEFVISVLGLGGAGFFLDSWLGTRPFLMVLGLFIGAAAGFWMLIKTSRNPPKSE